MLKFKTNGLAGIQYAGESGTTRECIAAVTRLLQSRTSITLVRILSSEGSHALLLTVGIGDLIVIKSGFGSGYSGEGAKGFSYVLTLLEAHKIEIEEIEITHGMMARLDESALTVNDLEKIEASHPVTPMRWYHYQLDSHLDLQAKGKLWAKFQPVIPFAIIDQRLTDIAIDFWSDPDQALMTAFRRLEDIVRKRAGSTASSTKLFSQVFDPDNGVIGWPKLERNERAGRMNLFNATFMAYRNPRAHCESNGDNESALAEFLLINQLYRLEREAT